MLVVSGKSRHDSIICCLDMTDEASVMQRSLQAVRNAQHEMCAVSSLKTQIDACHLSSERKCYLIAGICLTFLRQVQDLERQLQDARSQLEQYRAHERSTGQITSFSTTTHLPDISRSPRRMLKARTHQDLTIARAHLSNVGRGVLKPPIAPLKPLYPAHGPVANISLPPHETVHHCLTNYYTFVNERYPILDWPNFRALVESLYSQERAPQVAVDLRALIFAVIGLGASYSPVQHIKERGEHYIREATSSLDLSSDAIGINQSLTAFLVSIFSTELNLRSSAFVWLGAAIRIAQDRGLHVQGGQWSAMEGETRKRIWYSLYVFDR